ncbi:hypothetical protein [Methylobacterium sp. ID0610]|uniref:hypothetical protein n=1 Tax=Methylobacterium carpenticola TaxID=3344827 RepID=UPI0036CACBAD
MLLRSLTPELALSGAAAGDLSGLRPPAPAGRSTSGGEAANWAEAFRQEYPDLFDAGQPPAPPRRSGPGRSIGLAVALLLGTALGALGTAAFRSPLPARAGTNEAATRLTEADAQIASLSAAVKAAQDAEAAARMQIAQAEAKGLEQAQAARHAATIDADALRERIRGLETEVAERARALDASAAALAASETEAAGLRRSLAESATAIAAAEQAGTEARSGRAAAEAALAEALQRQEAAPSRAAATAEESGGAAASPAAAAQADPWPETATLLPRFVSFHATQPAAGPPFAAPLPSVTGTVEPRRPDAPSPQAIPAVGTARGVPSGRAAPRGRSGRQAAEAVRSPAARTTPKPATSTD